MLKRNQKMKLSKSMISKIKKLLGIIAFFVLIGLFEWYGLIGFLAFFLGMLIWRLYKGRYMFQAAMQKAETQIFGKPLEKLYWKKNELKNTKVKVVWKKKKSI